MNHDIQFVNPLTGNVRVDKNTQEGLWHNVKKNMDGRKSLENVLVNFMFRRSFNANAETTAMVNAFIGHLMVLGHIFLLKYIP